MKFILRFLIYVLLLTLIQIILYRFVVEFGVSQYHVIDQAYSMGIAFTTLFFSMTIIIPNIISGLVRNKTSWWSMWGITLAVFLVWCIQSLWEYPKELVPNLITGLFVIGLKYPTEKLLGRIIPMKYR